MTDQPPPSPGGHPAPPDGGYPPPPTPQDFSAPGAAADVLPVDAYTSWFTRVLAWLIDYIPFFILLGIGYALLLGTRETDCAAEVSEFDITELCTTGSSLVGQISIVVTFLLAIGYATWNFGYRQGRTGSSVGKSILGFQVVSEKTGRPIGFGMSAIRQLAHCIDALICYIGYLVPLWDRKRQTIADKLVGTVCLPL